jgi:hypothetical protein
MRISVGSAKISRYLQESQFQKFFNLSAAGTILQIRAQTSAITGQEPDITFIDYQLFTIKTRQ